MRLRAVARALAVGYRPHQVVAASLPELDRLLSLKTPSPVPRPRGLASQRPRVAAAERVLIDAWIDAALLYDEAALAHGFFEEWNRRGPLAFLTQCAAPFVEEVGRGWEIGELSVSQEHFASERLADFLAEKWRRMNEREEGASMVLTTLPGEAHHLGLQMAAVVAALAEKKVIYLGPDTPCEEIIAAVLKSRADQLGISVSVSYDPKQAGNYLRRIRERLDDSVEVWVGGSGAPEAQAGIIRVGDLVELYEGLTRPRGSSLRPSANDRRDS